MKKFAALALCFAMLFFTACASIFAAEYYDSQAFTESGEHEAGEQEIKNYASLKAAILELVQNRSEQAFFRFASYNGSLVDDLAAVCVEIKNDDPLGAYALEDISYDTSRIVSYYTSEIRISYKKSAEEIAAVRSVSGLGEFGSHVRSLLETYSANSVVRVYSSVVNEEYIKHLVEDYCYSDPMLCVLVPKVDVRAYPDSGAERIYEISLSYGAERDILLEMDRQLSLRAEELVSSFGEDSALNLALAAARQLAEMPPPEGVDFAHPGTAYGTLIEGSTDPLGLAMAYKLLCSRMGIDCYVVRGEYMGHTGEYAWNIIELDGEYYHADISRLDQRVFLLSDEDIWGEYYWSKDAYPRCGGSLGPGDVFEMLAEQTSQPEPQPEPSPEPSPEPGPEPDEENIENS